MSIGEDDPAALIDGEAGGIASTSGLSVKSTTGGCPWNDDGGDLTRSIGYVVKAPRKLNWIRKWEANPTATAINQLIRAADWMV
ncbi:hypothetical protein ACFX13_047092 [Malus domestica]